MNVKPPILRPLINGDRMTQAEFHHRYKAYPEDAKFELIGGIVYLASSLRRAHGRYHPPFSTVLCLYAAATPGVEALDNTTMILEKESELQPDLALRILSEHGGQSLETEDDYVQGPPELVAEIAHNTRSLDMNRKRNDYEQNGVAEYLVLCVEEQGLHWFDFRGGRPIQPKRKGIARSRIFLGLWIDSTARLSRDTARLVQVVQQGIASRMHSAFAKRLEAARRKNTSR